jgi:murein DD-endopeptidase MepM/ murein hydrolase activator NlpD
MRCTFTRVTLVTEVTKVTHSGGDPRSGRRRTRCAVAALVIALPLSVLAPAYAVDPDVRRQEVEQRLAATRHELNESTTALARATEAYQQAEAQLPGARSALATAQARLEAAHAHLSEVRGQLAAARAADQLAAERLAAAVAEVRKAEQRIAETTSQIDGHRSVMGRVAAHAYQQGSLGGISGLASVINARNVDDFNTRVTYAQTAITSQDTIVDRLEDTRAVLANDRVRLDLLRQEAQRLREEAAAALRQTEQLEAEARSAEARAATDKRAAADAEAAVAALVGQRQQAMSAAKSAADADAAEYAALEQERQAIEAEIAKRAQEAAAAAARQAAAAEAARQAAAAAGAQQSAKPPTQVKPTPPSGNPADAPPPVVQQRKPPTNNQESAPAPNAPASSRASSGLGYPLASISITSPFGMRLHPVLRIRKLHDGTDFRAPCGTPIYASAAGEVVWATSRGGYGNQVMLDHGAIDGRSVMTSYSHLSSFAVSRGQQVTKGQLIGRAGTTGYSTGCHLHFMVYVNGSVTNPMGLL